MKHCVLSVILLATYPISLQIERIDNDEIDNLTNCKGIGAKIEGNICTCSSDKSTLTLHPGETYYCKELDDLKEKCKYSLFCIVHVTLIALLFALSSKLTSQSCSYN